MNAEGALVRVVRQAIYSRVVATGGAPSPVDVAGTCALPLADVEHAYRALADAHVIVLKKDSLELWSAPPFSVVPAPFKARANGLSWYAPCAWDAFGIPAALKRDALIEARCARSGDELPCGVANGRAFGRGVIHLRVPARHFWDDIVFT